MAGRLVELRCALPVEHHVTEADPNREPAACELGHLRFSAPEDDLSPGSGNQAYTSS